MSDTHFRSRKACGFGWLAPSRILAYAFLLPVLAGEKGDEPVPVMEVHDVEDQRLGGDHAHGFITSESPRTGRTDRAVERRAENRRSRAS